MARLLFLLFALTSASAFGKTDTELHIEYTAAISSGAGFFCQEVLSLSKMESFVCSIGGGMVAGAVKEILDSRCSHNNFSGHDIRNDAVGSLVGAIAYRLTDDVIFTPVFNPAVNYYGISLKVAL